MKNPMKTKPVKTVKTKPQIEMDYPGPVLVLPKFDLVLDALKSIQRLVPADAYTLLRDRILDCGDVQIDAAWLIEHARRSRKSNDWKLFDKHARRVAEAYAEAEAEAEAEPKHKTKLKKHVA